MVRCEGPCGKQQMLQEWGEGGGNTSPASGADVQTCAGQGASGGWDLQSSFLTCSGQRCQQGGRGSQQGGRGTHQGGGRVPASGMRVHWVLPAVRHPGLQPDTTEAGLPQSSASTFLGQGLFTYSSGGLDSRVLRAPQTIQTRVYELL